mgnify:CR=1 FL=1
MYQWKLLVWKIRFTPKSMLDFILRGLWINTDNISWYHKSRESSFKKCTFYTYSHKTFPTRYLFNVCNVLQLTKVSKNLAYPGLKYPNNVQLSHSHDIHNIQKLVFVLIRYCILYSQIYNSAISLYCQFSWINSGWRMQL